MSIKKISNIATGVFLIGIFAKIVDCFRSPHSFAKIFQVSSSSFIALIFLFLVLSRILNRTFLTKNISNISAFFLGPFILAISCGLAVVGSHRSANFIYSKTWINLDQVFLLGVFITGSGLISQSNDFFKKYYREVILLIGVLFLTLLYFYGLLPFDARLEIVKEDHLIENMQALTLLIACFYSAKIGLKFFNKQKLFSLIFFLLSFGLFLTFGDEISWGQRVSHVSTPSIIAKSNQQNEITIHNNREFVGVVPIIYMFIGFYGAFAWVPYSFAKKSLKKRIAVFIPGIFLFPYFFFAFFYNLIAEFNLPKIGVWSEPAELMLYSGVMFTVLVIYFTKLNRTQTN